MEKSLQKPTFKSWQRGWQSEILNGIRIREAKKLLTEPSLRIGEIAEMVGFSDMAHFSRVFKKVVGISANEYRNSITIMDIEKKK